MDIESKIIKDALEIPQFKRGQVWCTECGATKKIDSGKVMCIGWPKCCGFTMTIDSPEERAAFKQHPTR